MNPRAKLIALGMPTDLNMRNSRGFSVLKPLKFWLLPQTEIGGAATHLHSPSATTFAHPQGDALERIKIVYSDQTPKRLARRRRFGVCVKIPPGF
jgi:hypothetical protein